MKYPEIVRLIMKTKEIEKILANHKKWLENKSNGIKANLSSANLRLANLFNTKLPSIGMVFLASWSEVSDQLCLELMRYDASLCGGSFEKWVEKNICPFDGQMFTRSINFKEKKELWSPGSAKNALELCMMLLKEKTRLA